MKHRKLFPALTAQNQTTDCRNYSCDPVICPYNCYSDYYYFPPPPPPPPPPISSQEPHRLPPFLIVVISLLASFFLLLGYYVIVVKRRNNGQPPAEAEDAEAEEGLDHNRIDHPIWFITTIGLQQSVINSITVCRYKKGEGLIEGTDCSVCLSEFQEDDTLRLLPKCNHAFHISCIDTWLRTHTNCPMCRARIVHDDPVTCPPPPLPPVSQNPDSLDSIARTQMENSATDGGLSNNQERNEACENRGETEQVTSEGVKNEINVPIRRSFSMDSVMAANLCLESEMGSDPANILVLEERDSSTIRPTGSSSTVQCLTTSPISMRRSFSCGGRFFSSRHNRSMNSILPR